MLRISTPFEINSGLGIGTVVPLFSTVVQNAVRHEMLGSATAALSFFRAIGSTIGVTVLGSVLSTSFGHQFAARLAPAVTHSVPPDRLAALGDPSVLLNAQALARVQAGFDGSGPQGHVLFLQLVEAIRSALVIAIHNVYLAGTALMILATVLCCFLREIPLQRKHANGETGHTSDPLSIHNHEPCRDLLGEKSFDDVHNN